MRPHYLHDLFNPKHIAVVGASDRQHTIGQIVFTNLLASQFKGKLTPVNLKHNLVGGIKTSHKLSQIKEKVDVAIVTTSANTFEAIIKDASKCKIPFIVLLKTMEDESDEDIAFLQKAAALAKRLGVRLLGPSVLGLLRPVAGLNASSYSTHSLPGNLALISQSSALCTAMLEWAKYREIGFSTILSLGDTSWDIDFGEILDYLTHDRSTQAILLHIQQVNHGRKFMSALRAAARVKPVVVIKSGRFSESFNGLSTASQIIDSTDVFECALARAGVLRVQSISQMFTAVKVLSANYRAKGDRLAIISNGKGLGVLAADKALEIDVPLAQLSAQTIQKLNNSLPANWSHSNPVDILSDASPLRFRTAVQLCLDDDNIDGVLVIFTPQNGTDHLATAQMMVQLQRESSKPLMLSWLGEEKVKESRTLLTKARCVQFNAPEYGVEVFKKLAEYHRSQELLLQTPRPLNTEQAEPDYAAAHKILAQAKRNKQTLLSESASKALLKIFNININDTYLVQDVEAACKVSHDVGFPVALKIDTSDIFDRSAMGAIKLNIANEESLRKAYSDIEANVAKHCPEAHVFGMTVQPMLNVKHMREVMISVAHDPIFGPVITFGAGGVSATIQRDTASALPPLNDYLIDDMIRQTKVGKTLQQLKTMPGANSEALKDILLKISDIVCELPEISELEINPIFINHEGALVIDTKIVLNLQYKKQERYDHMAIMPYPHQFENDVTLKNGTQVQIRPSRPEDADMLQDYVRNLSDQSRYNRFMSSIKQLSQSVLARFTLLDYDREMALLMVYHDPQKGDKMIGIARYVTDPDLEVCEFATSVADDWQGQGAASILMNQLFDVARHQGLKLMRGEILVSNTPMAKLMQKLGFSMRRDPEDNSIYIVEKPLYNENTTSNSL